MNLEDLKQLGRKERPPKDMTEFQWNQYFDILKMTTEQSNEKKMRRSYSPILVNGYRDDSQFAYCGETQWSRYCQFINSVLNTIRHNEFDYCFCIYQIVDLLKFEHDRLEVKWLNQYECFQVSLKK